MATTKLSLSTAVATTTVFVVASAASLATLAVVSIHFRNRERKLQQEWQKRRNEERTGRIRAEVRLRTAIKGGCCNSNNNSNSKKKSKKDGGDSATTATNKIARAATRQLQIIGTVVSPYSKRMGCPRQPQLVPSSRGYIQFASSSIPPASLDGIEQYSHLWIIFEFHANTNIENRKTKIRPPRGNGQKVGQLATRSPHRPNPIGLSLIQFDRWDRKNMQLHISGLDLVNGTPVFDIKPCVPWDMLSDQALLRVPDWVEQDDAISQVDFTDTARQQLEHLLVEGRLAPLYTVSNDNGADAAFLTIKEILAQDPRSSHKGVDSRGKASGADDVYSLIFGQCRVEFCVSASKGVTVTRLVGVDFDPTTYVEGIPLISENKEAII